MRSSGALLAAWLAVASLAAGAQLPRTSAVPGGVVVIRLGETRGPMPQAKFGHTRVLVARQDGFWHAVVGLPLSLGPGRYELTADGIDGIRRHSFSVAPKAYAAQYLTLQNRRQVEPTPEDLARIAQDREAIERAFTTWTARELEELSFDLPAQGRLSSQFGLRRFFNNQPRQPHSGIDIAAPLGTPVTAPADGRVIEIGDYFFNGLTLFLDHGQGLVSMFNHLNRVAVPDGASVRRGEVIGEIGSTGRVTGPHLHWSVSLNNSRVDPMLFLGQAALQALRSTGDRGDQRAGRGQP